MGYIFIILEEHAYYRNLIKQFSFGKELYMLSGHVNSGVAAIN